MSDDRRRGEDADGDGGPGALYMPYVQMEDLLDKLKLMDYEKEFCKEFGFKPFSRHYFALPTNPGEQFFAFTSLAAWLFRKTGMQFDQPQEYDDPNATISSILDALRSFGHSVDFPPSKLKQGCGEQCIYVLARASDEALKKTGFSWKKPIYPEEEQEEDNVVEDESELNLQKVEDEMMADDTEEEFEEEEHLLDLGGMGMSKDSGEGGKPEEIMESNTDAHEWKLEVERVQPQLKVTIRTDNKDWRVHVEQMHTHKDGIETSLTETKTHLDKLHDEITRTLEKIGSREKYINNQLEHLLNEFRSMQDQAAETKERYRQGSGGVTERTRVLAEVTEELERVKMEMEEKGSSMTDGAPLVNIKKAIAKIKQDMNQMDIRTGVVEHILLQARLKDKNDGGTGLDNEADSDFEYKAY
ncbi:intraflagellar transport protein 57 homolog [Lingula anatina]|uniref:Intraflagellar transport protein 57 homolog n=1 Tax=Lingula anatina TaxID=7574 RepID=A0A1S3HWL6_LINAN|nr:intraflagellar transport protein 57 homolog [Lingula anatina]XP_013389454.1 intraflagellar transport protein 57 homolog [Lingula anatina]|eukprot:XP_013389445.1 intraflagellar transport protein 57 homolog [Lingula anatina]